VHATAPSPPVASWRGSAASRRGAGRPEGEAARATVTRPLSERRRCHEVGTSPREHCYVFRTF
jgi:hypothetical protein